MASALRQLGYTVNDFPEHLHGGLSTYLAFLDGKVPMEALLPLYEDVDAVTDQPTCHLWPILLQLFPDAKVILMERENADEWVESYVGMLDFYKRNIRPWYYWLLPWLSSTHNQLEELARHNMILSTSSTSMHKKRSDFCVPLWKARYLQHNAAVRAIVPQEQLLVHKVGDGWEQLCNFLDKPIPDTPWPHENKAGSGKGNIAVQYAEFEVFRRGNFEAATSILLLTSLAAGIVTACYLTRTQVLELGPRDGSLLWSGPV